MSHFGRYGPPDISDTYSLLVLNVTFRTTPDDLFPYFEKYGKVVDVFIPRDRRTGESRGFAFVRYKYQDEAQKAVDRLDGRVVDRREIRVQFAKNGPHAERIHKGRIIEPVTRGRSRSHSPRRRHRDYRKRSRSRSLDRYDRDRIHGREQNYHRRSRSRRGSLDYNRGHGRGRYDDEHWQRRSRSLKAPLHLNVDFVHNRVYLLVEHHHLRGRVLTGTVMMNALQAAEVFHDEVDLLLLVVLLIQTLM